MAELACLAQFLHAGHDRCMKYRQPLLCYDRSDWCVDRKLVCICICKSDTQKNVKAHQCQSGISIEVHTQKRFMRMRAPCECCAQACESSSGRGGSSCHARQPHCSLLCCQQCTICRLQQLCCDTVGLETELIYISAVFSGQNLQEGYYSIVHVFLNPSLPRLLAESRAASRCGDHSISRAKSGMSTAWVLPGSSVSSASLDLHIHTARSKVKALPEIYIMTFAMTTMNPSMIARTPLSARPTSRPLRKTVPRANPFIGETNDPEKVCKVWKCFTV